MTHEEISVDSLIEDIYAILDEQEPASEETVSSPAAGKPEKKPSVARKIFSVLGKLFILLLETVLLLAVALYGVMFVLAKGPSPTARDLFVRSVQETSAAGFLAKLFLTDEEIAQYKALTTHKPVTNIFNDADAHMKVDYVADPKTYIDNKIEKAVAELSAAIITE